MAMPLSVILQQLAILHGTKAGSPGNVTCTKTGCFYQMDPKNKITAGLRGLYSTGIRPQLLGFIQTGLIADTLLIGEDESSVIRVAA